MFGLKEPVVIAVRRSGAGGILTEDGLKTVRALVERLEAVPNIDVDRITSLVSRSAIAGGAEGLEVTPLLPDGEIDAERVRSVRDAIDASPLYDGTLVSKDRTATIIAAELLDEELSAETYQAVLDLTRLLPVSQDIEVFVAGAGAITGYFSSYVDRDAGRLVPFTAIAVTVVLFCAFLTIRSAALPMFIAATTIARHVGSHGGERRRLLRDHQWHVRRADRYQRRGTDASFRRVLRVAAPSALSRGSCPWQSPRRTERRSCTPR